MKLPKQLFPSLIQVGFFSVRVAIVENHKNSSITFIFLGVFPSDYSLYEYLTFGYYFLSKILWIYCIRSRGTGYKDIWIF